MAGSFPPAARACVRRCACVFVRVSRIADSPATFWLRPWETLSGGAVQFGGKLPPSLWDRSPSLCPVLAPSLLSAPGLTHREPPKRCACPGRLSPKGLPCGVSPWKCSLSLALATLPPIARDPGGIRFPKPSPTPPCPPRCLLGVVSGGRKCKKKQEKKQNKKKEARGCELASKELSCFAVSFFLFRPRLNRPSFDVNRLTRHLVAVSYELPPPASLMAVCPATVFHSFNSRGTIVLTKVG